MNRLKIGSRLGFSFSLILLLMIAVAYIGMSRLTMLNDDTTTILREHYPATVMLNEIENNLNVIARGMRNMLLSKDAPTVKKEADRIVASRKVVTDTLASLDRQTRSEQGRALLKDLAGIHEKYLAAQSNFMPFATEDKRDEGTAYLLGDMRKIQTAYFDTVAKLKKLQGEEMAQAGIDAEAAYRRANALMLTLTAVALLMAVVVSYLVTRSITRPMNDAVALARTVAAGDLTSKVEVTSDDETGQLMQALKDMSDSLHKVVGEVRNGTDTIVTASSQIASGNLDLSSRTEEQASALEETASSMEELTSTVRQNADNARQANQLAHAASEVAVKGGLVVSQVIDTMGSINESSKKIVDIIGVIDGIAFQTNILALNAAVEAARAGEQGRGFAVVASEVRNLAQRSAAAAREIKTLIGDSVDKVDIGAQLVDQAGVTMSEVVASVKRVTDIIGEITMAGNEQTSGIEQINQAVIQMDNVTQQNAALVEQIAAAAHSMQEQSGSLSRVVHQFKLNDEAAPVQRPAKKVTKAIALPRTSAPAAHAKRHAAPVEENEATEARPRKAAQPVNKTDDWEEF